MAQLRGAGLRLKARPEDFNVREVLRQEPGQAGDFAVYRLTKRLLTTIEAQQRLAAQIGVPPRALSFPALKDKGALATQFFSLRGRAPDHLAGEGYTAQFAGRTSRPLAPQDLAGNWFTVTVRGLKKEDAAALLARLPGLERQGLPNYFDEQRFGGGVEVGKRILLGDAEGALRAYFTQPLPGDPPPIRAFKRSTAQRWGDWAALFQEAPRSNHRSILTFLKDHPDGYRKALNLVTPRLLPLLLAAYQGLLWNRIASRLIEEAVGPAAVERVAIGGEPLAVYRALPETAAARLRGLALALPQHRAQFQDPDAARIAADVLASEGLELSQVKARILQRAYLPRGARPLLVQPKDAAGRLLEGDGLAGLALTFFLSPGSYATLVLKVLEATALPPHA